MTNYNPTNSNDRAKKVTGLAKLLFFVIFGGVLFVSASLNIQPWIKLGSTIAQEITILPGQSLLEAIPFVGGWIKMLLGSLGSLIGVLLWAWCQIVQVAPLIVNSPNVLRALPNASREWLKDLKKYRTGAYLVEVSAMFLAFPPYGNGFEDFWFDFGKWDWFLIDWKNAMLIIVSLLAFEATVIFILKAYRGLQGSKRN